MTPEEALLFLVTAFKWYLIGLVVFGAAALIAAIVVFRRIAKRRRVTLINRIAIDRMNAAENFRTFKQAKHTYRGKL